MIDRRTFMSLLATAAVAPRSSFAQGTPGKAALYSSVGPVLTHYDVDVEAAALTKRASVTLPANVQYAWPHASRRYLYVASSSSAPGTGPAGTEHHVSTFRIDPASGALAPHGNAIRLPTQPWAYVSLERENKLDMFKFDGDTLAAAPTFRKETLAEPDNKKSRQAAGTVHVHPNGRFVYGVNRADTTTEFEGRKVFVGGENSLAVYSIDPSTGEPKPIQHVDTRGIHCRTFHIDASGRMLVAAHITGLAVRDGAAVRDVPACMSVFRIGADGRLDYVRKYDIDTCGKLMFWMGMVKL